ncbi:MAG: hypothetical protein COA54_11225 [Thiotrichaceae bacterium]|nr:MAG: hypothetical protein COA54_11225 [Thiotrichaceae bacterium]
MRKSIIAIFAVIFVWFKQFLVLLGSIMDLIGLGELSDLISELLQKPDGTPDYMGWMFWLGVLMLIAVIILEIKDWWSNKRKSKNPLLSYKTKKQESEKFNESSYDDMPLIELFDYLKKNINYSDKFKELDDWDIGFKIAMDIKDKASLKRLDLFARIYRKQFDQFIDPINQLEKIKLDDWNDLSFTMNFEAGEIQAENDNDTYNGNIYRDIQAERKQVLSIWPVKYKTTFEQDFNEAAKYKDAGTVPELQPDANLSEAIDYLIGILFPDRNPRHLDYQVEFPTTVNEITAKLRTGELKSWGLYIGESVEREFNKDMWEYRELLPLESSIDTKKNPQTKSVISNTNQHQLTGLRVNMRQAKDLWRKQ